MTISSKRLSEVGAADIREFVKTRPLESENLELKQTLPARDGNDPWVSGENRIGDRARNELVEEVCAFANAHGGLLLIGITESDDHPKRAVDILPIPRCADLAARLRLQFRDCIEPQLASIEVEGVPTDASGNGVVAVRVPESAQAPHRSTTTRECYIRRADRSEKMTMREIQDLTLARSVAGQSIATILANRSRVFRAETETRGISLYAMRATGLPLGALAIERTHGRPDLKPTFGAFRGSIGGTVVSCFLPSEGNQERPILRGTRLYSDDSNFSVAAEVYDSGLVEYRWWSTVEGTQDDFLFQEWAAGTAMNLLLTCDRFRRTAGAPGQEYAIEFELYRVGGTLRVGRWGGMRLFNTPGGVQPNPIVLPSLSLGERDEIPKLVSILYRDINAAAGFDAGDRVLIPELPSPAA